MKRVLISLVLLVPMIFPGASANAASCLSISKWYPSELLSGNESGTGKLKFVSAKAVKSPDFKNVYFVAVKFKAAGVGNQIGVWAVSGKLPQKPGDLAGLSLSANTIAQQFTVWPDGNRTQAQISTNDRSISAAIKCLK
jgi:hypothetical protein